MRIRDHFQDHFSPASMNTYTIRFKHWLTTCILAPRKWTLERKLFLITLLLYTLTRLIALEQFPIYFFTDEAAQTVLAEELVKNDFHDANETLLPTYFENNYLYNLSLSVYVQVIPYMLFGKTIFVTRATSALISLFAAVAVGVLLRDILNVRQWWIGSLALSITPAWYLHTRTAFETVLFVTMYTLMLFFYLRYRSKSPTNLLLAILFAGLAFYSYSGGQLIIAGTAVLLLVSDLRYHWQNKRIIFFGLILAVLLFLPYIRFQLKYEGETYFHLRMLGTYWLEDMPLRYKINTFIQIYLGGLNPVYWYHPQSSDLPRHVMQGYGHILIITLPFLLIGLIQMARNLRQSHYRSILITLIAAPLGAAIVGIGITRILSLVIPAAILTALGLSRFAHRLSTRISHTTVSLSFMVLLGGMNVFMLLDSLTNGHKWYQDYGLYGAQYGAKQVFEAVEDHLTTNPNDNVLVSPTWSNGTHILKKFFIPDDLSVMLGNADYYLLEKRDLDDTTLLVLTEKEYSSLQTEEKVTNIRVENILNYPDGNPGFYFIRMSYAANFDELLAEEKQARLQPAVDYIEMHNQMIKVEHSQIDLGEIDHVFDDDPFTLIRTFDINPAWFNLIFARAISVNGITLTTGSMDITLTVRLFGDEDLEPVEFSKTYVELPDDPSVDLPFTEGPWDVMRIEITILGENLSDDKVHIRDITLY